MAIEHIQLSYNSIKKSGQLFDYIRNQGAFRIKVSHFVPLFLIISKFMKNPKV